MRLSGFIACVAAIALVAGTAAAGKWPKPAAGRSASGDPELILTFDDGPHESYTPTILAELERRGVKATFFWVGHRVSGTRRNVSKRRAVVRQTMRAGHLIGNHTINHAQLCSGSRAEAEREIDENAAIYQRMFDLPMPVFRAPYGANCRRLRAMLDERGMQHFHWDFDPREWIDHDADRVVAYVTGKLRHLEGRGVLLMHDTKLATVRALPRIFDWLERENARRVRRGERPIRILSFMDLAREQLAPGLEDWARDAVTGVRSFASVMHDLVPGVTQPRAARTYVRNQRN